ncbi:TnsA endonuclease N-terminal domain-containing protein [Streptomyces sp. NPDC003011]
MLALDFAGEVIEVLSQPLRLAFHSAEGRREHTPDFLVLTRTGMWLVDVRPAELIEDKDRESFAAAAELAGAWGWHFAVAAGWRGHVPVTLDWLSSPPAGRAGGRVYDNRRAAHAPQPAPARPARLVRRDSQCPTPSEITVDRQAASWEIINTCSTTPSVYWPSNQVMSRDCLGKAARR